MAFDQSIINQLYGKPRRKRSTPTITTPAINLSSKTKRTVTIQTADKTIEVPSMAYMAELEEKLNRAMREIATLESKIRAVGMVHDSTKQNMARLEKQIRFKDFD